MKSSVSASLSSAFMPLPPGTQMRSSCGHSAKGRDCASIAAAVADQTGRAFLSGQNALAADGSVIGLGDPAAQTNAALDHLEAALSAAGGSLGDITKLTTCIVDRDHRKAVYEVIGRRLAGVFPVSTGLVVAGF